MAEPVSLLAARDKCVCPPPAFVEIRESPNKGLGVFACKSFTENELVEIAPVVLLPGGEWIELEKTQLRHYYYYWDEEHWAIAFGFGSMYNHDDKPNIRLRRLYPSRFIEYRAARDIHAGEELCIDYGYQPV
jgi:SET domain-containing protein